ncbi:hypothetical protein KKB69_01665 [Patescibacteria group bacterium]|nr:hypothetical protein [Patescibacteria group bacterium]
MKTLKIHESDLLPCINEISQKRQKKGHKIAARIGWENVEKPDVLIWEVGGKARYIIIDGHCRLFLQRKNGKKEFLCNVYEQGDIYQKGNLKGFNYERLLVLCLDYRKRHTNKVFTDLK